MLCSIFFFSLQTLCWKWNFKTQFLFSLTQDLGNLNCTFFSNRHDYERLRNLKLACDAINSRWNLGLLATERGNILDRKERKVRWYKSKSNKKLVSARISRYSLLLVDKNILIISFFCMLLISIVIDYLDLTNYLYPLEPFNHRYLEVLPNYPKMCPIIILLS